MTTLAETLAALKSDELERLWVECEGYRATGVLAGDAELRRMVDAFYFGAAPAAHLVDGVHQVTYEMAKRARASWFGASLPVPTILEDRVDLLRTCMQDVAEWLERTDRGGTAHHRHMLDVLARTNPEGA